MPVVKRADTYRWTVRHQVAQRAGVPEFFSFDVEFKALPQSKVTEILKQALDAKLPNERFIDELICGWHDIKRADGEAWEFSVAAVLELCEIYPGMPASLSRAWTESVIGATGAARKN